MAQLVKNLPAMWETWVPSLGWEDPLEEGRSPGEGNSYSLQYSDLENSLDLYSQSMGSQRVRNYWVTFTFLVYSFLFATIKNSFNNVSLKKSNQIQAWFNGILRIILRIVKKQKWPYGWYKSFKEDKHFYTYKKICSTYIAITGKLKQSENTVYVNLV